MDDETVANFSLRYGWPACDICEMPALGRVAEWVGGEKTMLVCFGHYIEYPKDPSGKERNFIWFDKPRGRK